MRHRGMLSEYICSSANCCWPINIKRNNLFHCQYYRNLQTAFNFLKRNNQKRGREVRMKIAVVDNSYSRWAVKKKKKKGVFRIRDARVCGTKVCRRGVLEGSWGMEVITKMIISILFSITSFCDGACLWKTSVTALLLSKAVVYVPIFIEVSRAFTF